MFHFKKIVFPTATLIEGQSRFTKGDIHATYVDLCLSRKNIRDHILTLFHSCLSFILRLKRIHSSFLLLFIGGMTGVYAQDPVFTHVGEGFDVSAAVYAGAAQEFYVGDEESTPQGLAFSTDGAKMFVIGSNDASIVEYTLGTAFDVSTAIYAGSNEEFSVSAQESNPTGLAFNTDGTKMFVIGSTDDSVVEYFLGVAFDVSSAAYLGPNEEFSVAGEESIPTGLAFNTDGTKMFVIGNSGDAVIEYTLKAAFDVTGALYAGVDEEFSVSIQDDKPRGFTFNADGTIMYVIGLAGGAVVEYTLTIAFDISTAVHVGEVEEFSVLGEDDRPQGLTFNPSGTRMFVIGNSGDAVMEYALTSLLDFAENSTTAVLDINANDGLGGATDAGVSYELEGDDAAQFTIDADGIITFNSTPNFEIPTDNDQDNAFEVSVTASNPSGAVSQILTVSVLDVSETPIFINERENFDISTAVYSGVDEEFFVGAWPDDLAFNTDGTKLFILQEERIAEYDLYTAFDISTAVYAGDVERFFVGGSRCFAFNSSGTKMFVLRNNQSIVEYVLTTAFDVSTANYTGPNDEFDTGSEEVYPYSLAFSTDGTRMFVVGEDLSVAEYILRNAFDVSSAVYQGEEEEFLVDMDGSEGLVSDLAFNTEGTRMFVLGDRRNSVVEYTLSSGFDVSTAIYAGVNEEFFIDDEQIPAVRSLVFNASGTRMYVAGATVETVFEYALPTAVDIHENSTDMVIDMDANDASGGITDTSVAYGLEGDDADRFVIDAAGVTSFIAAPNFENPDDADQDNIYEITVTATSFMHVSRKNIVVTVLDVDDGPPIFTHLGEDYNVSTAQYTGADEEFLVNNESRPTGLAFNTDGTKMFVVGTSRDAVVEYTLSTAFDASTAIYAGADEEFSIGRQENAASGLAFNTNGTKMFVIGISGGAVVEYALSTAFDVSTAVYSGVGEEFSVSGQETSPSGLTFNTDGTKMFLVGRSGDAVVEYTLSGPFDVSTAVYAGVGQEFSVRNEATSPSDVTFNTSGDKMLILDLNEDFVSEYTLSTAFDVSTAQYSGKSEGFSVRNHEIYPHAFAFNEDGSKMFVVGEADEAVVEYDLFFVTEFEENSASVVVDIDANDWFGGDTDTSVDYELEGEDVDLFTINESGEITFNNPPNFEIPADTDQDNRYQVTVTATNVREVSSEELTIIVLDDEDTPLFTNPGEGYDVSTASYAGADQEFSVYYNEDTPRGIAFNTTGTKMFVIGSAEDAVFEYSLIRAFDVSTATYAGDTASFTVGDEEDNPGDLAFNQDGSKMFVIGNTDDAIVEYVLTTAFDVSTAVYSGSDEEFYVGDQEDNPQGIAFNTDGSKMFVIGNTDDAIVEYMLNTPFDISTSNYAGINEEFSVFGQEASPQGLAFNAVGTKMFVIGSSDDAIVEYKLSTAFDVSSAVYAGIDEEHPFTNQENLPRGLAFNTSGTKLFIIGNSDYAVVEYSLISLIELNENETIVMDIDANDGLGGVNDSSITYGLEGDDAAQLSIDAEGVITFNTALNIDEPLDENQDNVYEVTVIITNLFDVSRQNIEITVVREQIPVFTHVGEGFDVSTVEYSGLDQEFTTSNEEGVPNDVAFSADGSKMFVIGGTGDAVIEYNLNTAFDISTAIHAGSSEEFYVGDQENNPQGLAFNTDGSKMFVIGNNDDAIVEYVLTTAFDVSSASYAGALEEFPISNQDGNPRDLVFNSDGSKMFVLGNVDDAISEYTLTSAFDISTATYAGVDEEFSVSGQLERPQGLAFNTDGTRLFVIGTENDLLIEYVLQVEYDVSSASYAGIDSEFSIVNEEVSCRGLTFNTAGTKMFVIGVSDKAVVEYALASIVDFDENSTADVIDIDANDGLGGATDSSVTYELEGTDATQFAIDADGVITFNISPDFEALGDDNQDNLYEVTVVAINAIGQSEQSVIVSVLDVDDSLPVFTHVGEGFDVSTAVYAGVEEEFAVGGQETSPRGLTFNADGTKMFVIGNSDDAVVEYTLSTEFDVSTAVYAGVDEEFAVSGQETSPRGFTFNADGTKMFVIGNSDKAVIEYTMGTAFDVSTAVYSGLDQELYVGDQEDIPEDLTFNVDGTKMFVIGSNDDAVVEYILSTAFDVSTAVYSGLDQEFYVGDQEDIPEDLTFNVDGTKMFVIGRSDDAIVEYTLSTAFDISTTVYNGADEDFYVGDQEGQSEGLAFNTDGSKMFVIGRQGDGDAVVEYALATLVYFDENSAADVIDIDANDGFDGATDSSVSYELEGTDEAQFAIDGDGVITFNTSPDFEAPGDDNQDNIYEVTVVAINAIGQSEQSLQVTVVDKSSPVFTYVGEGFDLSTAVYSGIDQEFVVSEQETSPRGLTFNTDGSKLFVIGNSDDAVVEYTLSTAFDVSTAVYSGIDQEFVVSEQQTSPRGLTFNADGTKMFVIGNWDGVIVEFSLSNEFDVSTAVYAGADEEFSVRAQETDAQGLNFNADGTKMFVIGTADQSVSVYNLSVGFDISTANYAGIEEEILVSDQETFPSGLTFNADGTKMYVIGIEGDAIVEFSLSAGFDISTAVYAGAEEEFSVSDQESLPSGLTFNTAGTKMFVIGVFDDAVVEYALASLIDFDENNTDSVIDIDANDGLGGGTDSSVTYELEGTDAAQFTIDADGIITFNTTPDFEVPADDNQDNIYEVTVVAINAIDKSEQSIMITVMDVFEALPIITSPFLEDFDVSEFVYTGWKEEFSVASQEGSPTGLTFNMDGTKMFVIGNGKAVVEYALSTSFDISTAAYAGAEEEFSVSAHGGTSEGIAFNADGTKMFVVATGNVGIVAEYTLGTAFDVSTAIYAGEVEEFEIADSPGSPLGLTFNTDGTKMFVVESSGDVLEYALNVSFDVSTAVYAGADEEFSVSAQESYPHDLIFNTEGTRMFVIGFSGGTVVEYSLNTAFDISTAVYAGANEELTVSDEESRPTGLAFNSAGTQMFVIGGSVIIEYALSSVFDMNENSTSEVVDIDANDGLGGDNDTSVTYELEGTDATEFGIDSEGLVTFNAVPDYENPSDYDLLNVYVFTVVAKNSTGKTEHRIVVNVLDVADEESPNVITEDITVSVDSDGNASIVADDIDNGSSDNVGISSLSLDVSSFDCTDLGANTVALTATDAAGNSSTGTATVTVVDELAPTVITQDITVTLDATGNVMIIANAIDNGSVDNCSDVILNVDQTSFDNSDIGENTVTLTVTDESGNETTGTATVTVVDELAPTVIWDGETDSDWATATNWVGDELPTNTDNVVIPDVTNHPVITSAIEVNDLDIQTGAMLTITSEGMTVHGDITLDGNLSVASGASLVPLGTIAGSGLSTINRNTTFGITDGKYSVIGSPITMGSTSSLGTIVYSYDETMAYDPGGTDGGARFVAVVSPETMTVGDAYFSANTGDISFTGIPNSGNTDIALVYDETNDGVTDAGFNLVSNPYTAAISYAEFASGNTDINGTIYLWDDGDSKSGQRTNSDYVTATSMGAASGGSNRSTAWDGYIRSTQGFIVKATSAGTLHFTPSMMDAGNNSDAGYFRTAETKPLRFSLSSSKMYNDILIGFRENATKGYDRTLDAYKLKGNRNLQFYSRMSESNMAIQALPVLNEKITVPLGFDVSEPGEYTLELSEATSYGFGIFLKDNQLDQLVNLTKDRAYPFTTSAVENSERFSLLFIPNSILTLDDQPTNNEMIVFVNGDQLNVRMEGVLLNTIVKIRNVSGRVVRQFKQVDFNGADWNTLFNEKGVFIITVQTNDQLLVKKFLR